MRKYALLSGLGVLVAVGAFALTRSGRREQAKGSGRYVASGYGGFVPVQSMTPALTPTGNSKAAQNSTASGPLKPAIDAYAAGKYEEAERKAEALTPSPSPNSGRGKQVAAQARLLLAFSAARRKDLSLARDRFAEARHVASKLPDHGKQSAGLGDPQPSIEEEAAYQHAVCTGALGEKDEAEREYIAFMKSYPESPLVHAAIKRVARFHDGNPTPEAEAAWKSAVEIAKTRDRERERQLAMCGPECLAELLRRRSQGASPATVNELAADMGTSEQGTSVATLIEAARKRGIEAKGLHATLKGLEGLKLPVIALVAPGHFVLVENVSDSGVTVWNPDGKGAGKAAIRQYTSAEWQRAWGGVVVRF